MNCVSLQRTDVCSMRRKMVRFDCSLLCLTPFHLKLLSQNMWYKKIGKHLKTYLTYRLVVFREKFNSNKISDKMFNQKYFTAFWGEARLSVILYSNSLIHMKCSHLENFLLTLSVILLVNWWPSSLEAN